MTKLPKPLLAILAGFTLLTILYGYLTPPFEGPDEPEHFAYIVWLAEGRGFPPQGAAAWETPVRQEAGQPPLYYLLAAVPAALVGVSDPPAEYQPNPHFPSSAAGTIADNKNRAIHDPAGNPPMRGGWLALYLARGLSLCFGLLLIVATYGLGREVFPATQSHLPLGAAALVAFNPQILFLSSVVTNDIAAAALAAFTLWALARLLQHGLTAFRAAVVGLAFALAILTKISNLALVLPIALVLTYCVLRIAYWDSLESPSRFTFHVSRSTFHALRSTLFALLSTLLFAGWWFGRSWRLYGTPFGLDTHDYAPWAITETAVRAPWLAQWREVFYSYWAAFGWGNIKFPGWVYGLLGLLCLAAVVGLIGLIWQSGRRSGRLTNGRILAIALFLALVAVAAALEVWMQRVTAPHGRLLFPAAAVVAMFLAAGWQAIHRYLVWGGVGGTAVLAVLALPLLIWPAYAPPRPLTSEEAVEQVREGGVYGWYFGEIAQLVGTAVPSSAAAGEVLPVRICWYVLEQAERDYSVLVQIIGPQNAVIAGRRTYPGLGSYPTSQWRPDSFFCDTVRLDIPADLAQTLLYYVEVAFIDQTTGERLPIYDSSGRLSQPPYTFTDKVRLVAAGPVETLTIPPGEDLIRLAGFEVDTQWQAGRSYPIVFYWWLAENTRQVEYKVFIHLRDLATGEIVAQADSFPLDGWYTTRNWTAGEFVTDRHTFPLPADIPAGRYDLVVGWYDPRDGARLGEEHELATIEVRP
jgi:4-amino-4-deoxy-L-arabinose transferase-like glycosyltransferase